MGWTLSIPNKKAPHPMRAILHGGRTTAAGLLSYTENPVMVERVQYLPSHPLSRELSHSESLL